MWAGAVGCSFCFFYSLCHGVIFDTVSNAGFFEMSPDFGATPADR